MDFLRYVSGNVTARAPERSLKPIPGMPGHDPRIHGGVTMVPVRSTWYRRLSALRSGLIALLPIAGAVFLAGCASVVETSWSPDSRAIAYSADGKLCVYDLATKQSRALDVGEGDIIAPAWSPDGKAIAFYSVTWGENARAALRAVDPTSGQVRTLASDVWPLPREVAAAKIESGQTSDEALYDAQAEAILFLAHFAAISWSPDSTRLACTAGSRSGGGGLLVRYPCGDAKPVIEGPHTILTSAWSPDGNVLAYVRLAGLPTEWSAEGAGDSESQSDSEEPPSLWLFDFGAGTASKLCDFPEGAYVPGTRLEWSADSGEIGLIVADGNDGRAIGCLVEARPGSAIKEKLKGITVNAAWAPGLAGVAFLKDCGNGQTVLIYRGVVPPTRRVVGALPRATPGEQEVQAESSDSGAPYSLPTFSRDGRRVALRVGEHEALQIAVFDVPWP